MSHNPLLSLIIPLHNEADNVLELHHQITEALKNFEYEIIYVDDASQDDTLKRLKHLQKPVSSLQMSKHFGQSAALLAGIRHAKAPYIVTLDGDLQNDPKDIPKLLNKLEFSSLDMIVGLRKKRYDSALKRLPSKAINMLLKYLFKLPISDMGCGLKVMTKSLALSLPLQRGMHRFLALNAHRKGARISEENVNHRPRSFGHSKYNLYRIPIVINDLFNIFFETQNPFNKARQIWNVFLLLLNILTLFGVRYNIKCYSISETSLTLFLFFMIFFGLLFSLLFSTLKISLNKYTLQATSNPLQEYSFTLIK